MWGPEGGFLVKRVPVILGSQHTVTTSGTHGRENEGEKGQIISPLKGPFSSPSFVRLTGS